MLIFESLNCIGKSILTFHCGKDILTVKAVPWGNDYGRISVMLAEHLYRLCYLLVLCRLGMGEHDSRCVCNLVVIELAKVLHIHFNLIYVGNGGKAVKDSSVLLCTSCRLDNVGELTDA